MELKDTKNETTVETYDQSDCTLAPRELIEQSGIYEICHQDEPRASDPDAQHHLSFLPPLRRQGALQDSGIGSTYFGRSRLSGRTTENGQPFPQDGDSNLYVPHATRSSAWFPIPARQFTSLVKQSPRRGSIGSRTRNTACLIAQASKLETNFRHDQSDWMKCALNC
jgi:hypothetical protein